MQMIQYSMMVDQQNSHQVIRGLFDQQTHESIIEYLDKWVPLLPLGRDDTEFVRMYYHNPPSLVAVHHALKDTASTIFGEPVKPSYCFLSMYKDGGTCPLHIDRPQCRYTIDYLIRQTQPKPWPICISERMSDEKRQSLDASDSTHPRDTESLQARIVSETWTTVNLNPNDAVCYSGTNSWHYRPEKLEGTADLVFFHFVPEAFDGPLD